MSQPISFKTRRRDFRVELRVRLEQAPADHAEAILAGYEVLQGLHDRGVLELLRGVLGGGDRVLEIAVEAAKTPEAIHGIRNLIIMLKLAESIDPDQLHAALEVDTNREQRIIAWECNPHITKKLVLCARELAQMDTELSEFGERRCIYLIAIQS